MLHADESQAKDVICDVDTAVFGTSGVVRFEYVGDGGSIANGYASGTAADGHSLFQASQGQT